VCRVSQIIGDKVTQFSLEHGVQISLDVKSDLFAFSKIGDSCSRTQEFMSDSTSQSQCLDVFAEAGIRPAFLKNLADMAPGTKPPIGQSHSDIIKGLCVDPDETSPTANNPTTVPPNWLTTPYVITRTSRMAASFGFAGPTLRVTPQDDGNSPGNPVDLEIRAPQIAQSLPPFVNIAVRNILLETELFPIMRTTIIGMEMFVVPFLSTHVQIKFQPKSEIGPCDATTAAQL
jgi:hypothetical protein